MKRFRRRVLGAGLIAAAAMLMIAVGASAAFGYSEFKTSGEFPVSITGKSGRVTLESEDGNSISCENSSMKGSINSATQLEAGITFSGKCEAKGSISYSCPAIETKQLTGQPGEDLGGPVVGKTTKDGVQLTPASGDVIAEFTCDETSYKIEGGIICESMPIGKLTSEGEIACKQTSAGKQEFTSIEIGGTVFEKEVSVSTNTLFFKAGEKDALSMKEGITFTKAGKAAYVEQTR